MRARRLAGSLTFSLLAVSVHAARVDVEVEGLSDEMREAVHATLELAEYEKRDISPAELRASFKDADEQVRKALEPFGYYDVVVEKNLSGDAANGWKARLVVQPGEPAVVRNVRVEVRGEGREQRRVAEAVAGFVPRVGERLDHASYEASKAVIDTSLRGAGFLDAKYEQRRVTVRPEMQSADIDLAWESGPRYRFGEVRFSGDPPFPDKFLREFVPWREGAYFNSEQVLNLQQRLVDADYFELVSVQPALDEKKDGTVPIDVLVNRDERTVYTGEVYYSTDFGAGVRVGAERRWLNKKGHKADVEIEYSQRLEEYAFHYQIPRPARDDRSYDYGVAYRDETTDVSRSRNFQLAATRTERRWHGFTRTLGFYKTHPGVTQWILDQAGGISVCGVDLANTDYDDSHSALEALCLSPKGDQRLQLVRQLTAATLTMSAGGATFDQLDECNALCITGGSIFELGDCINAADNFNNSGDYLVATFDEFDSGHPEFCQIAHNTACNVLTPGSCAQ